MTKIRSQRRWSRYCILTQNCDDFHALHRQDANHFSIIGIYRHAEQSKDMTLTEIMTALANLQASGWDLTGQFVALNAWNFAKPADP